MSQHAFPAWGKANRLAGVVQVCVQNQCGVARVVVQLGTGELIEASIDAPWTKPHLNAIRPRSEAPFQAGDRVELVIMGPCVRVLKPTDDLPSIQSVVPGKAVYVPPAAAEGQSCRAGEC